MKPRERPEHHVTEEVHRRVQFTATFTCVNSSGLRPRAAVTFFHTCARRHWNVLQRAPPPPPRALSLSSATNSAVKVTVRFLTLSAGTTA